MTKLFIWLLQRCWVWSAAAAWQSQWHVDGRQADRQTNAAWNKSVTTRTRCALQSAAPVSETPRQHFLPSDEQQSWPISSANKIGQQKSAVCRAKIDWICLPLKSSDFIAQLEHALFSMRICWPVNLKQMHDQQITYLSSNQRWTHMVCFLCCFAVKNSSNIKASASLSCAIFFVIT